MKIVNRLATRDYSIFDRFEAGVKLIGPEVKSAKRGHVSLRGAYVKIAGSEVYLINAQIQPYEFAKIETYDPQRTRKLLLNKKQIISLRSKIESEKYTLIPISLYQKHGLVKVEIGLARGKKLHDRREELKKRALKRELERDYRRKDRRKD